MATKNPTRQQWEQLLGDAKYQELVKLLMGARRESFTQHPAAADLKVVQALRLLGQN